MLNGKSVLDGVMMPEVLKVVVPAIEEVAKSLGILIWSNNVEDLGEKALLAEQEGYGSENFKTYKDYVDFLNEYKPNADDALKFSAEEKLEKGYEIIVTGLTKELGKLAVEGIITLIKLNPQFYIANRIIVYIQVFNEHGIGLDKISEYMERGITRGDAKEIVHCLVEAERKLNPMLPDFKIEKLIESQRTPI